VCSVLPPSPHAGRQILDALGVHRTLSELNHVTKLATNTNIMPVEVTSYLYISLPTISDTSMAVVRFSEVGGDIATINVGSGSQSV
jgi:hypothetical protein